MTAAPSIPLATYRFQFNRNFTFRDAARLVPYLAELGVSHCYASPYLRSRPGSLHGYDIIDHSQLNPEIGSPQDYEYFVSELHRHGMGQILDIVPNHMGVMGADNSWWLDVLENGEASSYAEYFDIDWSPIKEELQNKVLVPVLADQYGNVLERGDLKLVMDSERGEFNIFYFQHRFPINPREYPRILGFGVARLEQKLGPAHDDLLELHSIRTAFHHLPSGQEINSETIAERNREKEIQKRRLATLIARSSDIRDFLEENVRLLNGTVGEPRSFDALHDLIKAQCYRLAQWRVAADDINYRRFFDINDLAALRMENNAVFEATHRFVLTLVAEDKVNGLRIDHPDGLQDPEKYFLQLQSGMVGSSNNLPAKSVYVVVEKILTGNEPLRNQWPVQGTTGYDFGNLLNGLFVDPAAAARMERIYRSFIGQPLDFQDLVYTCRKLILKIALASELNVLANVLSRIALSNRHTCDFTLNSLRSALGEVIACFPVYRTYVSGRRVAHEDRRFIEMAVAAARKRTDIPDLTVFDFIRRMLLVETNGVEPGWYRLAILRFAMKFQQVTSAAMAKGLEDTALYRYHRLISLNDVGGDPNRFGITVEEFHRANQKRLECWPHSMLSTSTHDTKRSEDVRARINVLSETPAAWRLNLRRWRDWNRSRRRMVDGFPAPSRNDEYLFYQTLVGAWPLETLDASGWQAFAARMEKYMLKAVREAKQYTSWANPRPDYEEAVSGFVHSVLSHERKNRFLSDFDQFHKRLSRIGMFNSLSQTLLKLISPGVPDIYQGNELWDFSLVDPDNRRPVNYERRQAILEEFKGLPPEGDRLSYARQLLDSSEDGRIKLYVIRQALCARRHYPELFQQGSYHPLAVRGPFRGHICAFARRWQGHYALVMAPRLIAILLGEKKSSPLGWEVWEDTEIELPEEGNSVYNVFTGERLTVETKQQRHVMPVSAVLANFPVALLLAEPGT